MLIFQQNVTFADQSDQNQDNTILLHQLVKQTSIVYIVPLAGINHASLLVFSGIKGNKFCPITIIYCITFKRGRLSYKPGDKV